LQATVHQDALPWLDGKDGLQLHTLLVEMFRIKSSNAPYVDDYVHCIVLFQLSAAYPR
jgi:hypothetical protein